MTRLRTSTLILTPILIMLACALWFYLTFIGLHSVYNGRRVSRKTQWYAYSLVLPIPVSRYSVYYVYQDQPGAWIREGPYAEYYRNGNVRLERYYLHGEQDGKESVFNEYGNEMFRTYWAQGKQVRRIQCPCVDP
jgi:hypothetical protein